MTDGGGERAVGQEVWRKKSSLKTERKMQKYFIDEQRR